MEPEVDPQEGPFMSGSIQSLGGNLILLSHTMSRQCSQVMIQRVLALSTTPTSLVPQNLTPPVYLSKGGSNSVAVSGSTGLRLEEPWAWPTRWYSVIMQSTCFPRLYASCCNTSRWRYVIPMVAAL